jgi:Fe-S-cluster containining protein
MMIRKRPADTDGSYRLRFPEDEQRHSWLPMLLDAYAIIDCGITLAIKREERRRNVTLACRKGCDHCCHTHKDIPLFPLEMVGIYWFGIEKPGPPVREILMVQLLKYERGACCPFLIQGACAIHPVRPVSCRQFNVFNRPCGKGEDPYYTRREDVLTPPREYTERAFSVMLPFYGITGREDRLRAIRENVIHSQVSNLKSCDWKGLGKRMESFDTGAVYVAEG